MHDAQQLLDRAATWRQHAELLRQYGAEVQAAALEACAADLVEAIETWRTEPLTLQDAEGETGYSYSALQQKVASGEIPNVGEKGRPRVRRCDLPRKALGGLPTTQDGEPDIAAEILEHRR